MQHAQPEWRIDARARAHSLGALFVAGPSLSLLVMLLPGWDLHRGGITANAVVAYAGAVLLYRGGARLSARAIHLVTGAGAVIIAMCQVLAGGGPGTAAYALLYVWVVLHCALFASSRAVVGHVAWTAVTQTVALLVVGEITLAAPQVTLTVGTQIAAAVVVGRLAASQRRMAETDALTGLANRRVAERALQHALARRRRGSDTGACVAVLDLDGFKRFNDAHGHAAGDQLLVACAAAWLGATRASDTLARTGGDEFVLVLPDTAAAQAAPAVRRLVEATPSSITVSVGISCWDGREDAPSLLERADRRLYDAKRGAPRHGEPTAPVALGGAHPGDVTAGS